jgi:hypothetical protein
MSIVGGVYQAQPTVAGLPAFQGTNGDTVFQGAINNSAGKAIFFRRGSYGPFTAKTVQQCMRLMGEVQLGSTQSESYWAASAVGTRLTFSGAQGFVLDPSVVTNLWVKIENMEITGPTGSGIGIVAIGDATHFIRLDLDSVNLGLWLTSIDFRYSYPHSQFNRVNSTSINGIYLKMSNEVYVTNSFFSSGPNGTNYAVNMDGTYQALEASVYLLDTTFLGFLDTVRVFQYQDVHISNCLFDGYGSTTGNILLETCSLIVITSNWISTENVSGGTGIYISGCTGVKITSNTFAINLLGINIANDFSATTDSLIIATNTFGSTNATDIQLNTGAILTNSRIVDNTLEFGTAAFSVIGTFTAPSAIVGNAGYNPKGSIATPWPAGAGNLSDATAAQNYPTSATLYTVTMSPKLIILSNCAGVTQVQIDGVTLANTTILNQQYRLEPGQTIKVTWAATTPNGQVFAQ